MHVWQYINLGLITDTLQGPRSPLSAEVSHAHCWVWQKEKKRGGEAWKGKEKRGKGTGENIYYNKAKPKPSDILFIVNYTLYRQQQKGKK